MAVQEEYTNEQAAEDIGGLIGQVDALNEYHAVGGLTLNGQGGALGTGLITGPDTWNSLGSLTGFTVTIGRYKLAAADNMVIIDIELTGSSSHANGVTFANLMPAAYRPTVGRHYPLTKTNNLSDSSSFTDQYCRVFVGTDGSVQVQTPLNNTSSFGTTIHCPLD